MLNKETKRHYNMTFSEIASKLGVRKQTVFKNYKKAIRKLQNNPAAQKLLEQLPNYIKEN